MQVSVQTATRRGVIARLLQLMERLTEDQQLSLLKQLLDGQLAGQLARRVLEMTDGQRRVLAQQLEEMTRHRVPGEKRRVPRKDCLIDARLTVEGPVSSSYILDINPYGAYVETDGTFSIGQEVRLRFASPLDGRRMQLSAKVIRRDARGVAVRFIGLTRSQLQAVKSFADHDQAIYTITS